MSDQFRIVVNDRLVDIGDLKVAELKVELKKRGISVSGNKQELVDKLKNVSCFLFLLSFLFRKIA
jgi:hypothetical protein